MVGGWPLLLKILVTWVALTSVSRQWNHKGAMVDES